MERKTWARARSVGRVASNGMANLLWLGAMYFELRIQSNENTKTGLDDRQNTCIINPQAALSVLCNFSASPPPLDMIICMLPARLWCFPMFTVFLDRTQDTPLICRLTQDFPQTYSMVLYSVTTYSIVTKSSNHSTVSTTFRELTNFSASPHHPFVYLRLCGGGGEARKRS